VKFKLLVSNPFLITKTAIGKVRFLIVGFLTAEFQDLSSDTKLEITRARFEFMIDRAW
jgi:hypothetical protein